MLEKVKDPLVWQEFYEYKLKKKDKDSDALKAWMDEQQYLDLQFSIPRKVEISKHSSSKKRIVYVYRKEESYVLKLLTYLLQRKYDAIFSQNLYSFRPHIGAKDAIYRLMHTRNMSKKWVYKVDISDYFNSIPIERILSQLKNVLQDDQDVYGLIKSLLENPWVDANGKLIEEKKGIMAGTAISTFLANVYLMDLDRYFEEKQILYARYSDDIIVFGDTQEALKEAVNYIHSFLKEKGLTINPKKELYAAPNEKWTFLGVSYHHGTIDVSDVSVDKLKAKMRRKMRALMRWKAKKGVSGKNAAKAFIRVFNQKLFENPHENELTWVKWYFPMINTIESLQVIDQYAQQCIRYLISGTHTKARYNVRYDEIKALGYRSLVNHYYKSKEEKEV